MASATTQHVIYPKEFQTSYRDSREKNIVIAASQVFIESGFDNASMDDIALRANVSKRTIYNRYASKQDVFDVAIIYACQEYSRLSLKLCFKTPIAEFLENTGYQILEHRTRPEVLALRRLILFQSASMPGLSEVFFRETLFPIVSFISEYLDQMSALGHVSVENPDEAAWDFYNIIRGPLVSDLFMDTDSKSNIGETLRGYAARGTKKFLRLYPAEALVV